jgi:hypothetical protein
MTDALFPQSTRPELKEFYAFDRVAVVFDRK